MPAILRTRWPYIVLGALALIVALVMGVNHALSSAKQAGRDEVQAKWEAEKAGAATARAELSAALAQAFNGLDGSLQQAVRTLHARGADITVRVRKDLDNDPRYSSAACALSDRVLGEVNAARDLSRSPTPSGVTGAAVPTSGAAVRLEFGGAGPR